MVVIGVIGVLLLFASLILAFWLGFGFEDEDVSIPTKITIILVASFLFVVGLALYGNQVEKNTLINYQNNVIDYQIMTIDVSTDKVLDIYVFPTNE